MLKRLLFSLIAIFVASALVKAQCPTLTGPAIFPGQACIGDVVTLTMAGGTNLVPGAQTVDWYSGSNAGFDPLTQGTYVGSAAIVGSSGPCNDPPIVLGGLVNPCNGNNPSNGSEENEAMFIWSAGGFNAANLGVEVNNLGGPTTENIGTLGPCPLLTTPTVNVAGGCVVYGGPATVVPANAFVLVFTSSEADINFDFSGLCALGFPIYIFQNSCTRLMGTTVPGAFSNSGPHSYMADFGCPGPNQSLTYTGSTGNNVLTAGWTILGINFPAPCNGTPFIPAPPTVPVASVTIDPLTTTITAADCGQQYFSAVVSPPVTGCPQTGVGSLSLFVECPELIISGSETVCVGSPSSGIQVSFSGTSPPYTFEYSINSVSQGPVTTSANPYTIPFTPTTAGTFTFDLVSAAGTTCPASFSGSASVTATPSGTTAPLNTTVCANDQPVDLTLLEDPAFPGGTWSGANVSGTTFNAGPGASGPYTVTYTPPAGSSCTTPGTATITVDAAVPIGLVTPPILCGPTTYDLNLLFGGSPIPGTWSGPNLTLPSTFNAPPIGGVGGTFVFTFTPSTGCFIPPTVNITVAGGTPAMPLNASVCVTSQPVDLTTLEDPAFPGGTWSGANVIGTSFDAGPSASGNYSITYTPPSGGGGCTSPGTSTITITPETNTTLATATACVSNAPIDLSTLVVGGFPTGTWSGTGVSGGFFDPSTVPLGTYTINFTPTAGLCYRAETTSITVIPAVNANLGTATLCVTDPSFALVGIEDPAWPGGSWSGPGVSGGLFNPSIAGVGPTTITYTPPSGQCAIATTTTITVTSQTSPNLGTATLCVTDPLFDLTTIQDPAFPTGTWSGTGVSGTNFNPSSAGVGPASITFTPSGGSTCEGPSSTTITVTTANTPVLGTATLCETDPSFDLTTIVDPSYPAGSWSGSGVSGSNFSPPIAGAGPISITFTPVAGSCASTVSTTITVNAAGPAQPLDATICASDQPLDLTTLDDPAAPGGTWSGANVTGSTFNAGLSASGSFSITYTPPSGGCASPGTATITISASGTPTLGTATVCLTGGLYDLFNIQDPAYSTGTWSGSGVTGSFFDPTIVGVGTYSLTFTPSSSCLSPASTNVTVSNASTPALATATLCVTDPALNLTTLEDPAFTGGVWSGPSVAGGFFDPSTAGAGMYTLTYTVSGGCVNQTTTSITVSSGGPAQPLDATICASDQPLDLTTLEDPAAPGGTWSGANVSGSTFNAGPSASGNYSVTYTPPAGGCTSTGMSTITISAGGTPALGTATVCISDGLFDLFNIQDPAYTTGTWSGAGVSGSFFDPTLVGVGSHGVTFTPSGGCLSPASTTIVVSNSVVPAVSDATLCISDSPLDLSTLEDAAYPGGTWTGPSVSVGSFDPSIGVGSYSITYTSSATCVAPASSTITVTPAGTPVLAQATVCEVETVDLTTLQDAAYPTGTWSGTNVSGTTFTAAGLPPAAYTLTFTPSAACAQASTTDITVFLAPATSGRDTIICAGSPAFDLDMMLNGSPVAGTWSGAGVAAGQFDAPNVASGTYGLTFTPAAGVCALPTMIQIMVQVSGTPTILDQTVCTSSPVIDLNSLVPAQYAGGVWSGTNVSGNSFDPSAVTSGNYRLVYTPTGSCTNAVSITITVSNSITLTLPPLNYCIDAGVIDLTLEDPAAAPGGTWSGPGISANQLDPTIPGAGNYMATYTPPAGSCATSTVTTPLQISPLTTVGIFTDTVCVGSGPINLNSQLDPSFATGSWSGASITSAGVYTPINTAGPDQITFTPQGGCYSAAQFTFDVVGVSTLSAGQPTFTCAPDGQTYTATFSVTTTPNNGTITTSIGTLVGSLLTITGLVSGTTNSVIIDDAASCNPAITVDVSYTCPSVNCTTEAGTLSGGPYQLCSTDQLTNAGVSGFANDGNDVLLYFLDDDTNPDNGTLTQSTNIQFNAPAGLVGQTLFVYALAGNDDGAGGVSPVDNCRSQSNAIQVTWAAPLSVSPATPVCNAAQDAFTVEIALSGGWAPYGELAGIAGSFTSPTVFTAGPFPSGTTVNLSFEDNENCGPVPVTVTYDCSSPCVVPFPGTFDNSPLLLCDNYITDASFNNNASLGAGDVQVFVVYNDAAGTIEIGRFPSLPIDLSALGLSSGVVYISSLAGADDGSGGISSTCFDESPLRAIQLGQTQIIPLDTTVCSGTVVMIAGTTYTQASNTGSYTLSGFGASCDTVVNVTVNFSTAGGTTIDRTDVICNNESLIIGGQLFNATNPSDTFTVGATACDTTYRVALTVLPPSDSLLRDTLCVGDSLVIGNSVFNQAMPSGTSILRARNGCDSIVTVELEFLVPPEVSLVGPPTYCAGADIEVTVRVEGTRAVMGDVFVNGTPTGSTTLPVGDNTLSFPATSGFSFRLSNIVAITGACAEAIPQQVSYSPQVSQLNAEIPTPLSGEFTACGDNTVASIAVQTGSGVGPYSFAWSTGDTTNTITNVGQGIYSVTITDNLGCTSMTDVTVGEGDTLAYTLSTIDPVCPGGEGAISISLDQLPPNAQFRFDLPGLDPVTSPDFSFDSLASGTYVFQLIQENGCDQSTLITIEDPVFYDIIRFDTIDISLGDSARIFLDLPNTLDSIRWLPGDFIDCDTCERVLVSPPFNLEYEAIAYTTEGCEVGDRVFIRVAPLTEIYIPTAFSPNGDRINDVLLPYGGPEVERIESFKVFDRWGNLLHSSGGFLPGDELFGWDGRYRDKLMDPAVFVTLAEVRFINGTIQTFTGDVTLIR